MSDPFKAARPVVGAALAAAAGKFVIVLALFVYSITEYGFPD